MTITDREELIINIEGKTRLITRKEIENAFQERKFKDNVVEAVRIDLLQRSQRGINKYGVTLDRNDLSLKDWLQHAYEECLDQANYLKRSIIKLEKQ